MDFEEVVEQIGGQVVVDFEEVVVNFAVQVDVQVIVDVVAHTVVQIDVHIVVEVYRLCSYIPMVSRNIQLAHDILHPSEVNVERRSCIDRLG